MKRVEVTKGKGRRREAEDSGKKGLDGSGSVGGKVDKGKAIENVQ